MELKSLDQIKDEYFGVKGTPDRDRFERELEALCIGVQIRNARQKKEMTQAQLADQLSVSHKTISKW